MYGLLKRMGVGAIAQHKVARRYKGRHYYLDFAIPSKMIAIECDGKAYHSTPAQKRHDARRQAELESLGWTVIRFTGSAIVSRLADCQQELQTLLGDT
jgi:very-short-patch-repair endonuclease